MIPKDFLPGVILTSLELLMTKYLENHCPNNPNFYIHFLSVLWCIKCYVGDAHMGWFCPHETGTNQIT